MEQPPGACRRFSQPSRGQVSSSCASAHVQPRTSCPCTHQTSPSSSMLFQLLNQACQTCHRPAFHSESSVPFAVQHSQSSIHSPAFAVQHSQYRSFHPILACTAHASDALNVWGPIFCTHFSHANAHVCAESRILHFCAESVIVSRANLTVDHSKSTIDCCHAFRN